MSEVATEWDAQRRWLYSNCSDFGIASFRPILTAIGVISSNAKIFMFSFGAAYLISGRCLICRKCDCQQEISASHSINRQRNDQMALHLPGRAYRIVALASIICKNWSVNIVCVGTVSGDFARSRNGGKYDYDIWLHSYRTNCAATISENFDSDRWVTHHTGCKAMTLFQTPCSNIAWKFNFEMKIAIRTLH